MSIYCLTTCLHLARNQKCVSALKGWCMVFDLMSAKLRNYFHFSNVFLKNRTNKQVFSKKPCLFFTHRLIMLLLWLPSQIRFHRAYDKWGGRKEEEGKSTGLIYTVICFLDYATLFCIQKQTFTRNISLLLKYALNIQKKTI